MTLWIKLATGAVVAVAVAGCAAAVATGAEKTVIPQSAPHVAPTATTPTPAVVLTTVGARQGTSPPQAEKGVAAWAFSGVAKALAKSGASWYYTWAPGHAGIASPRKVQFVPMIWGAGNVTSATLRQVKREGHYLLGFNEPDNSGQSNMTVSQALALWPQLMATRMKLGSPAVATGAATAGGWLDQFMQSVKARGYRVNFITVHWYGGDFATGAAVRQLRSYLDAIHARYRLPIWLTEFALIRFGTTATFPTPRQQAAFVTAAARMLKGLSFVRRYAWFALPATSGDGTAGLFRTGAVATAAGRAFAAIHT